MAARSLHEVRDAVRPQLTPEWPVENYVDARTGQRSRRQYLGSCAGGVLLIARSTGVDLYFRRTQGNAGKPRPSEIDLDLRKFIERCWQSAIGTDWQADLSAQRRHHVADDDAARHLQR